MTRFRGSAGHGSLRRPWWSRTGLVLTLSALLLGASWTPALAATRSVAKGGSLTVAIGAPTTDIANTKKFNALVATEFHQQTGATLNYQYYNGTSQEETLLETSVANHVGPDVFNLGFTFVPAAYATNEFVHLTPHDWSTLGGMSSFLKNQLTESGPDLKHTIAVPVWTVPHALVYNTELFKKAGIAHPPTTWSEFIADAQKINNPSAGIYGADMDPQDSTDPWKNIWSISEQMGGRFLSPNAKTVKMDSPINVKATEFWFDWYTKYHVVPPPAMSWNYAQEATAFATGKVGMETEAQLTDVPTYEAGAIGNSFAFAPMPNIPFGMSKRPKGGLPAETVVSGQYDVIAKYSKSQQLAFDYLKLVTGRSVQTQQWKLESALPSNAVALKAVQATDPALLTPFVTSAENGDPTPFTSAFPDVELAWSATTQKLAAEVVSKGTLTHADVVAVLKSENAAAQKAVDEGA